MNDLTTSWHPSKDEVAHILAELRPVISRLADRQEAVLATERWRRDYPLV
jgi:hypothetical protein